MIRATWQKDDDLGNDQSQLVSIDKCAPGIILIFVTIMKIQSWLWRKSDGCNVKGRARRMLMYHLSMFLPASNQNIGLVKQLGDM